MSQHWKLASKIHDQHLPTLVLHRNIRFSNNWMDHPPPLLQLSRHHHHVLQFEGALGQGPRFVGAQTGDVGEAIQGAGILEVQTLGFGG